MNGIQCPPGTTVSRLLIAILTCLAIPFGVSADAPHLSVLVPGGMPGLPVMTGIQQTGTNQVRMQWDGPSGAYQLIHKSSLADAAWQPIGPLNTNRTAVVGAMQPMELFGVLGPSPNYVGSQSCEECHPGIHGEELDTAHAHAFETLQNYKLPVVVNGVTNVITGWETTNTCLRCHTVGRNPDPSITQPLPTGFINSTATPYLEGVQCENCHGPAGLHVADPYDATVRPQVDLAAQVCGGCHQSVPLPAPYPSPTLPYYEDWSESGHAEVLEELQEDFQSSRGPTVYIPNCGRCHSGSVRQAYLSGQPLPDGHEASAVGIVCATCHDPHQHYIRTNVVSGLVTTNQLRNPAASFEDYHTTGSWDTNYNPNINICGQCHNDRGASWQDTSRPPHHSPQYNVMLGTAGLLPDGWAQRGGYHAMALPQQCASCHMQTEEYRSESLPAVTGHTFEVQTYDVCMDCHLYPEKFVELFGIALNQRVERVKQLLDQWATNNAPEAWQIEYGTRAWEYATPGDLSAGGTGPTSAEQAALLQQQEEAREQHPDDPNLPDFRKIQQARFNLYLVVYDGSTGVHNGAYEVDLLDAATEWVLEELDPVEAFMFELDRVP